MPVKDRSCAFVPAADKLTVNPVFETALGMTEIVAAAVSVEVPARVIITALGVKGIVATPSIQFAVNEVSAPSRVAVP
jgi:hypothetical protein